MEDVRPAAKRGHKARGFFFSALLFVAGLFLPATHADAASLFFSPGSGSVKVGQTISVSVYVESKAQSMNATQGVVSFPTDLLSVTGVSKGGSILNLWVQDPASAGTVNFEGIVYNPGFQAASGKVMTITFRAKKAGTAQVKFSSGAVLANDGQGTNITSGLGGAKITIGDAEEKPEPTPTPTTPTIPGAPVITSASHPDPNAWYQKSSADFSWSVPSGVTGVSVSVDQSPTTDPGTSSEGVVRSYRVENQADGVWYVHVRFRNAQGWGPATHYRFQIDTTAPDVFSIAEALRKDSTENTVRFLITANDARSGIDYYEIRLNDSQPERWIDDGSHVYTLTNVPAGEYTLSAKAFDKAGNVKAASASFAVTAPVTAAAPVDRTLAWLLAAVCILLLILIILCLIIIFMLRRRRFMFPIIFGRRKKETRDDDLQRLFDELRAKIDEYSDLLEKNRQKRLTAEARSLDEENFLLTKLKQGMEDIRGSATKRRRRSSK